MSERQQSPYDSIARKWLALVERRQQNIIELCNSGRWQSYYTGAQFLDEMRKVLHLRNQWAELASVPVSEQIEVKQNIKQSDRPKPGEPQAVVAEWGREPAPTSLGDFSGRGRPALTLDLRAAKPYLPVTNVTT